ncbi:MAG: GIY-YIG nuclease family protein [Clostridia bacterium]|nr:GIY-YIG nuclease family protein [Clostridia bacterium]
MESKGVIYILTNPSFPEYVKIGYADDINKRLKQLNRSECVPFAFRVYATYEVSDRLSDIQIHNIIDSLNPNLRSIETFEGKKRVREFYAMSKEDAYKLLEGIAKINGLTHNLKLHTPTIEEIKENEIAVEVKTESTERRSPFSFYACGIKKGEKIVYKLDDSVVCTVEGDRIVSYNGEKTSVSALAQKLHGFDHPVQGTLWFTYNGEVLADMRIRLEAEGKYGN